MKIAVLGAEGQLGSELCRQLGPRAVPLGRTQLDIASREQVEKTLLPLRPAAVINTAAYTAVDRAEQEPEVCRAVNAQAVGYLAEACAKLDCPLVQISTDYVFGQDLSRTVPYTESDPAGPLNFYGASKLAGENAAAECSRHLIVRTCGLYGPRTKQTQTNFVDTMRRLAGERKELRVVNDQHCTPSYTVDVAQAILFLLESGNWGLYHVVNTGATTWHDFAAEIFRCTDTSVRLEPITTAEYPTAARRPAYSVLDTAKYHTLGGPLMRPWPEALAAYLSLSDRAREDRQVSDQ